MISTFISIAALSVFLMLVLFVILWGYSAIIGISIGFGALLVLGAIIGIENLINLIFFSLVYLVPFLISFLIPWLIWGSSSILVVLMVFGSLLAFGILVILFYIAFLQEDVSFEFSEKRNRRERKKSFPIRRKTFIRKDIAAGHRFLRFIIFLMPFSFLFWGPALTWGLSAIPVILMIFGVLLIFGGPGYMFYKELLEKEPSIKIPVEVVRRAGIIPIPLKGEIVVNTKKDFINELESLLDVDKGFLSELGGATIRSLHRLSETYVVKISELHTKYMTDMESALRGEKPDFYANIQKDMDQKNNSNLSEKHFSSIYTKEADKSFFVTEIEEILDADIGFFNGLELADISSLYRLYTAMAEDILKSQNQYMADIEAALRGETPDSYALIQDDENQ